METFDPYSFNAQVATMLQKLDELKEAAAASRTEMRSGFERIDSRVTALEQEKWYQRGAAAVVSIAVVAAWNFLSSNPDTVREALQNSPK